MRLRALARTSRTRGMSPTEAAAHWIVRQDSGALGADDSADFEQWRSDPVHADAYRKASGAMALFDFDAADDPNLRALRQAALDAAPAPRPRYRLVGGLAIAASLAGVLALVGIEQNRAPLPARPGPVVAAAGSGDTRIAAEPSVYRTGVGERRTVRLPDGSNVTLNTNTRMVIAFSEGRRLIHLSRGQALFEVAHDANRPFTVEAADRQVTALGTIFEVRVDPGRVNVVLFRGRVVVDRVPDAPGSSVDEARITPTILKPGQQFDVELGAPQKVVAVDMDRQLLWRNGFVEFDDETLGHAVAEMNRYASKPIVLNNDGVAALHVSGLFRTGSPDQFIDAIQGILPVTAKPNAQGGIELSLASRKAP